MRSAAVLQQLPPKKVFYFKFWFFFSIQEEIAAFEVAGSFVLKQLIELSAYFDMVDEVSLLNLAFMGQER